MGGQGTGVRLCGLVLSWLAGVALQLQQAALSPPAAYAAAAGVAVAIAVAGRRHWLARFVAAALLAYGVTGAHAAWRLAATLPEHLAGRDVVLTGIVAELPRVSPDGVRFVFDVESAEQDGAPADVPPRVSLGWYSAWHDDAPKAAAPPAPVRAGQRWRLTVRLKPPHAGANPHGFDAELWLFEQGIRASGSVRTARHAVNELLDETAAHPVERLRQHLRDAVFAQVGDARAAGVLAALAIGDQGAIDRDDWNVFRDTGTAHLMAISGLHVTMFAWLAGGLVAWLWRRSERLMLWRPAPVAARWGGLAAAAGYALLAGWGVPAQRTVWMLATAALLASVSVRWPWPLVLCAAAVVVTALDPWALLQPGFWLSFAAVGLLLVAVPDPAPTAGRNRLQALRGALARGLRTQVVATLGLAPLTLIFFQQVSLIGFIANLIAIPLVTLVVTPLALAGVLLPPCWTLAAVVVQALTAWLHSLAALPAAVWTAAAAPPWLQGAALLGAVLLLAPLPARLRWLSLPLMLPLFAPPLDRPAEGDVQVTVADVGQGSAILVRTRHHALLHDTGAQYSADSDAGTRVLVPLLRALGVRRLDLLMLSHRDNDHTGGAPALLAALDVGALSSSLEASHPLLAAARSHRRCEAGQSWRWDGVEFRVLHPAPADHARPDARPNTLSCVLSLTDARGRRWLLPGDLEAEQEARLVRTQAAALRSDVLLVPHHGSKTSSTPAFLAAVAPRIALVQAGYRNRFGHPAPEVVQRYATLGIPLVGSVECGAWSASSDGAAACERQRSRRYWHHGLEVARSGSEKSIPEGTVPWPSMSR